MDATRTKTIAIEEYQALQKICDDQKILIGKLQERIQELEYKLEIATIGD